MQSSTNLVRVFLMECVDVDADDLILFLGIISFVAQLGLTASAKFESATKISIYRKAFDVIFAFLFQILLFHVSLQFFEDSH
jgi:hypothetical protein